MDPFNASVVPEDFRVQIDKSLKGRIKVRIEFGTVPTEERRLAKRRLRDMSWG